MVAKARSTTASPDEKETRILVTEVGEWRPCWLLEVTDMLHSFGDIVVLLFSWVPDLIWSASQGRW